MMIARGGKSQETGEKKIPELMEDIKIPTDKKKKNSNQFVPYE